MAEKERRSGFLSARGYKLGAKCGLANGGLIYGLLGVHVCNASISIRCRKLVACFD